MSPTTTDSNLAWIIGASIIGLAVITALLAFGAKLRDSNNQQGPAPNPRTTPPTAETPSSKDYWSSITKSIRWSVKITIIMIIAYFAILTTSEDPMIWFVLSLVLALGLVLSWEHLSNAKSTLRSDLVSLALLLALLIAILRPERVKAVISNIHTPSLGTIWKSEPVAKTALKVTTEVVIAPTDGWSKWVNMPPNHSRRWYSEENIKVKTLNGNIYLDGPGKTVNLGDNRDPRNSSLSFQSDTDQPVSVTVEWWPK